MVGLKKFLVRVAVIAIAAGIGSILASIGNQIPSLSFLAITANSGFDPIHLNLIILDIDFGLWIHPNIAQIIAIVVSFFISPKIVDALVK